MPIVIVGPTVEAPRVALEDRPFLSATRADNVGLGAPVFRDKTGVVLHLRTLVGAGNTTITETDDAVIITASTSALPENYAAASTVPRSTTTLPAFQTFTTLVTGALTGTFRVGWSAVIDSESAGRAVRARLRNQTTGTTLHAEREISPGVISDRYSVSGIEQIILGGVSQTLAIEFSRAPGGAPFTVGCQDGHLEFWRVA